MKFYDPALYQSLCRTRFTDYSQRILQVLPHARIEHVGASSVDGLISKGDLDIFVGVDPLALEQSVLQLLPLGFTEKIDTLRTHELCMLESQAGDDVALQVVANGSKFEFFLTFREILRQSPQWVVRYNALKRECEGKTQHEYRAIKSAFISEVLSEHS